MTIPTQTQIEPQLLLALHSLGGNATSKEAVKKVQDIFPNLTEEEKEARYEKTGTLIFGNKTAFARESLKIKGFISSDSPRGIWELSENGKQKVQELLENPSVRIDNLSNQKELFINEEEEIKEEEIEPLSILQKLNPYAFERLCGLVLKKTLENVKITPGSGDKGIDGRGELVIGLVRIKVVFQAKRYQQGNSVGSPDIQKLAGAMQQDKAEKAVFITTSHFSSAARTAAKDLGIELIDGERLIEILQKNKIGFIERMEYEIDPGFFYEL